MTLTSRYSASLGSDQLFLLASIMSVTVDDLGKVNSAFLVLSAVRIMNVTSSSVMDKACAKWERDSVARLLRS